MVHIRAALTACASSEPHEPKHQARTGSLLTSCNTFREYTVYVYPPEFYSCQILSHVGRFCQILFPSKPVVRAIEVSHAACKDEFRRNRYLTADVFSFYNIYKALRSAGGIRRPLRLLRKEIYCEAERGA